MFDVDDIKVTIVKAEDLIATDRNGLSDPYIEVYRKRTDGDELIGKTKTQKKCLNPEYNETFLFEGDYLVTIKLKVKDWNLVLKDVEMGELEFHYEENRFPHNQDNPIVLPLSTQGKVHLIVHPIRSQKTIECLEEFGKPGRLYTSFSYPEYGEVKYKLCLPCSFTLYAKSLGSAPIVLSLSDGFSESDPKFLVEAIKKENENALNLARASCESQMDAISKYDVDEEILYYGTTDETCFGKFKGGAALFHIRYFNKGQTIKTEFYSYVGRIDKEEPFFESYAWNIIVKN